MYMLLNPEDYQTNSFFNDYTQQAEDARQEADKYIDTIEDLREALLALPENRIQRTLDLNASRANIENAKIAYKGALGEALTSEDYDELIRIRQENIA